ncbi:MAG TPA: hypothetical protein VK760_05585 [Candidatus Acidoferrales bacterium]|jgi:hypothetical protein|nr:hypothetical protein [Candidatus Acidoferrales bacterium]
MLKTAARITALALLAGCGHSAVPGTPPVPGAQARANARVTATLGAEQNVIPRREWGTRYVPDERMTYYTAADGTSYLWMAGGTTASAGETIAMTTDFAHVKPRILKGGRAVASLFPNHPGSSAPDADYAGPGSVFRAKNGRDLLMIYHGENHTFNGVETNDEFYATICLARSSDNGLSWRREGAIVTGMQPKPSGTPPRAAMGAGNPSAIIAGGYIYVFYVNLGYDTGPDQTHVARAPIGSDGRPGTWRKWYAGSFSQPGIGGKSTPVMARAAPADKTVWAANGIVSYDTYLHAYLNVFQTAIGFYYATSPDLLHWRIRGQLFAFGYDEDSPKRGQRWYSYPSFFSPEYANDRTTGRTGYLYYAKARWAIEPHTMYRRRLDFNESKQTL